MCKKRCNPALYLSLLSPFSHSSSPILNSSQALRSLTTTISVARAISYFSFHPTTREKGSLQRPCFVCSICFCTAFYPNVALNSFTFSISRSLFRIDSACIQFGLSPRPNTIIPLAKLPRVSSFSNSAMIVHLIWGGARRGHSLTSPCSLTGQRSEIAWKSKRVRSEGDDARHSASLFSIAFPYAYIGRESEDCYAVSVDRRVWLLCLH